MTDFNAEVGQILINLVLAVLVILSGAIVAAIKKRLDAEGIEIGLIVAQSAVQAIEQIGARRGWTPEQKLHAALGEARRLAESYGLKLTDAQWETLIEQAVAELKRAGAELTSPDQSGSTMLKAPPLSPAVTSQTG